MQLKNYTTIFTLLIVMFACESKKAGTEGAQSPQKDLVIYGSAQCSHCVDFMAAMDENGVTYIFNDVDLSDKHVLDMQDWVASANFSGRISFPVIVIDYKEVLIAPEPELVVSKLK